MRRTTYSPTLVVGLGGTGASVLRNIKRRMNMYHDRDTSRVKLLLIDGAPGEQKRDEREVHFRPEEFVDLSAGFDAPKIQESIDTGSADYAHIDWLPPASRYPFLNGPMTSTRCVGRLGLFTHFDELDRKISVAVDSLAAFQSIRKEGEAGGVPQAYLVSSVCGGTGAGTFLDVAYLMRKHLARFRRAVLTGLLVLPSGFRGVDVSQRRMCANAYAALIELDHFTHIRQFDCLYAPEGQGRRVTVNEQPFDVCFLVEGENEKGMPLINGFRDVAHLISEQIFLRIGSEVGEITRSVFVNVEDRLMGRFDGKQTAYSAIGLKGLEMPVAAALRVSGPQLALAVVRRLLGSPAPVGDDTEKQLDRFLRTNGLAQTDEDNQIVNHMKAAGPNGQVLHFETPLTEIDYADPRTIGKQLKSVLDRYREQMLVDVQLQMRDREEQFLASREASIRRQVCDPLDAGDRGIPQVEAFLAALQARLDHYKAIMARNQLMRTQKMQDADQELKASLSELDGLGRGWLIRAADKDRALRKQVPIHVALADKNLGRQHAAMAREEAIQVLKKLSDLVGALQERTSAIRATLFKIEPNLKTAAAGARAPRARAETSLMEPITTPDDLLEHAKVGDIALAALKPSTWLNLDGDCPLDAETIKARVMPDGERVNLVFPSITERFDDYKLARGVTEAQIFAFLEEGALPCLRFERERLGIRAEPVDFRIIAGPEGNNPLGGENHSCVYCSAGDPYRVVLSHECHGLPLIVLTNVRGYREAYEMLQGDPDDTWAMVRPLHCFKGAEKWEDPCRPQQRPEIGTL